MIGNDIIDLETTYIESNWQRPGFLDKIFSTKEQEIIQKSDNKTQTLWTLWTMKEAGYKAHQRRFNLKAKYNPTAYKCKLYKNESTLLEGKVSFESFSYHTQTFSDECYIHTVATALPQREFTFKIFDNQREVKPELIEEFSAQYRLPSESLKITKDRNSVPHFSYKNQNLPQAFSLSHHGKFSAFVLALTNY